MYKLGTCPCTMYLPNCTKAVLTRVTDRSGSFCKDCIARESRANQECMFLASPPRCLRSGSDSLCLARDARGPGANAACPRLAASLRRGGSRPGRCILVGIGSDPKRLQGQWQACKQQQTGRTVGAPRGQRHKRDATFTRAGMDPNADAKGGHLQEGNRARPKPLLAHGRPGPFQ